MIRCNGTKTHLYRFEHIFWVDASNKDTLEQSYKGIAPQLSTDHTSNSSLNDALSQLERLESEWLLLFDAADEIEAISGFLPPGNQGNVLYTSRNPVLRSLHKSQTYEIDAMAETEAVDLLLNAARLSDSPEKYKDSANSIAKELGCLALAIDQAGAYIANGQCSIHDFLRIFRSHRQELMQKDAYRGASGYDRSVYATWDLSYNAIKRTPNTEALRILKIFAFFHNENIMIDIFRFAAERIGRTSTVGDTHYSLDLLRLDIDGKWDSFTFREGVRRLLGFSLIHQDESGCYFSMHRLVHEWIYDVLTTGDQAEYSSVAYFMLAKSISWRFETEDFAFRRALLPHITSCKHRSPSESEPNISHFDKRAIALAFHEAGRWKEAEKLNVEAMEMSKYLFGEEHPDTMRSILHLASTYEMQRRSEEAEKLLKIAIEIGKRSLGEEDPETLIIMVSLANTHFHREHLKEAEKLYLEFIEKSKTLSSKEDLNTLAVNTAMRNLAKTYSQQGRLKEAEELEVKVMKMAKKVFGEEHPYTLGSISSLAATLGKQGRLKEAEELLIQVISTSKRILGQNHPQTLISISNLAFTYSEQGRFKEAEELGVKVLNIEKQVLGEEHPTTLTSMNNLAHVYYAQGQKDTAIQLMTEAVSLRRETIGSDHPSTINSTRILKRWCNESTNNSQDDGETISESHRGNRVE